MKFKNNSIILFLIVFFGACATQENYLIKNINFDGYKSLNIDSKLLEIETPIDNRSKI